MMFRTTRLVGLLLLIACNRPDVVAKGEPALTASVVPTVASTPAAVASPAVVAMPTAADAAASPMDARLRALANGQDYSVTAGSAKKSASTGDVFEPRTNVEDAFVLARRSHAISFTGYDPAAPVGTLSCECERAEGASTCSTSAAVADCERTYPTDCVKIVKCIRGDAHAPPTCAPGKKLVGTQCKKR